MPQASDELRNLIIERFGSIDESGPISQLSDNGYKLTKDWRWAPPEGIVTYDDMSQSDFECLLFLVHEWDFGGLIDKSELTSETNSAN